MANPSSPDRSSYRPDGTNTPGGGGRHPRRRRRGMGLFGWLGLLVMALLAIVIGALAVFVLSPPTDLIRNQMITQVKQRTGRDLTISGPVGVTVFPKIGLSLQDVALSSPPNMGGNPLVKMSDLTVQVKLLPLIRQQVEVDALVLTDPVFDLRVNKKGQRNWDFARAFNPTRTIKLADASGSLALIAQAGGATGVTAKNLPIEQLALGDVRIVNGTMLYSDATTQANHKLNKINVALSLDNLSSPLGAKGDLVWKSEKIKFDGTLTAPKQIMQRAPADLTVALDNRLFKTAYRGKIVADDVLKLSGILNANVPSTRKLASWLGSALPKVQGFGPLTLKGKLSANGPNYQLSDANLNIDNATATGQVSLQTAAKRPRLIADLSLSELNLNKYLPGQAGRSAPSTAGGSGGKKPQSIDDLLGAPEQGGTNPATRVKGYSKRAGWSTDPIDFSALQLIDADAKLKVGRLLYEKIKVDKTNLAVKLNAGKMRADFTDIRLYEGRGRGVVTLDGTKKNVGANFIVDNISALPLLTDAADLKFIEGRGTLKVAVAGRGGNQRDIIKTLNGNGSFDFKNGAIVGVNVPAAYRSISQGNFQNITSGQAEKTDFSELTATFKIANGIATNQDLAMASPLMRLTGAGSVFLPERRVDYTVRPKVVADLSGQGGASALDGIEVPVKITGTFDNLKYTPQLGDILKDPSSAAKTIERIGDQVKDIKKKFKGKKPGEIINDLLGGGEGEGGENGKQKIDGKKLLDQFFR